MFLYQQEFNLKSLLGILKMHHTSRQVEVRQNDHGITKHKKIITSLGSGISILYYAVHLIRS